MLFLQLKLSKASLVFKNNKFLVWLLEPTLSWQPHSKEQKFFQYFPEGGPISTLELLTHSIPPSMIIAEF